MIKEGDAVRRVVVYHGSYGCDTGCCGHTVEIDGDERHAEFKFEHPYYRDGDDWGHHEGIALTEGDREFVRRLVIDAFGEDHCADIDWEHCIVSGD